MTGIWDAPMNILTPVVLMISTIQDRNGHLGTGGWEPARAYIMTAHKKRCWSDACASLNPAVSNVWIAIMLYQQYELRSPQARFTHPSAKRSAINNQKITSLCGPIGDHKRPLWTAGADGRG